MKNNCNYSSYNLTKKYDLFNDKYNTFFDSNNQYIDNNDNIIKIIDNIFDNKEETCGKKYRKINMNIDNNKNDYTKINFNQLLKDNDIPSIINKNKIEINENYLKNNDNYDFAPFLLWKDNNNTPFIDKEHKQINTNSINFNDNYEYNIEIMKEAFFSKENIDYIQKSIILKVYNDTDKNIILKPQKYEIIIQIMNNFWINNCRFLPYNFKEQIEDLNSSVIKYSTNELIKESYFHLNYLKDRDNRDLINTPINTKQRRNI